MLLPNVLPEAWCDIQLRTADLAWRRVEDDIIVLDMRRSRYLRLNTSAAILWERLAKSATEADLCRALIDRFGADEERAGRDVARFLADVRDAGLLE